MHHSTQLDFFEQIPAVSELRDSLEVCNDYMSEIQEYFIHQQDELCQLYLSARMESESLCERVAQLEAKRKY